MANISERGQEHIVPRSWIDYVGFGASFLCAIHCVLTPLLLMTVPVAGSYFLYSHFVEVIFVLFSSVLAFFSVCWGYRLHEREHLFALVTLASSFLVSGIIFYHKTLTGFILLGIGGFSLALTHYINYKLCEDCGHCE